MQTKVGVAQSIYVIALLAEQEDNKPLKSNDISSFLKVSDSYLKKVVRKLVVAGILSSSASKTGGVFLKKSPDQITMLDIYLAIESNKSFFNHSKILPCLKLINEESILDKAATAVCIFQKAEDEYKKTLSQYTIADILESKKGAFEELEDAMKQEPELVPVMNFPSKKTIQ